MQFVRNTLLALATGYVLFFFSERLFWSAFKPGDHVGELAITWLAYSVIAYLFLSLVRRFRVRGAWSVFLAGACFGWLTEGALVGTLYGTESSAPFPLSLLVTGVSWHALISVWIGWHFLRRSLRDRRPWKGLAWSAGLGLFWGAWATFLWRETPPIVAGTGAFAAHAVAITALLAGSYGLIERIGADSFRPRPFGFCVAVLVVGVFYVQQVKTLGARPVIVLPTLLAAVSAVLWRASRGVAVDGDDHKRETNGPRHLGCLAVMPAVATGVYALLLRADWWGRVPIAVIVMYGITAPVSAVLLVWALVRAVFPRDGSARGADGTKGAGVEKRGRESFS